MAVARPAALPPPRPEPRRASALRVLLRSPLVVTGLVITALIVLAALLAPLVAPHDPFSQDLAHRLKPPGTAGYVLGSDTYGRDVLSRMIWGARASLVIGVGSVLVSLAAGTVIGLSVTYWGGWLDEVTMRVLDVLLAFPAVLLGLMVVTALGSNTWTMIVALAISLLPSFTRMARATALQIKGRDFVQAAVAAGASPVRIALTHLLPNIAGPLVVIATLNMATAILVEAALSFLGLGVQPPTPSWGNMIKDGLPLVTLAPWLAALPGIGIFLLGVALNVVGDGVRDLLDPHIFKER